MSNKFQTLLPEICSDMEQGEETSETINTVQEEQKNKVSSFHSSKQQLTTTENSLHLNNAIKISRQIMILLEDYRYLMSCYQDTCGCHVHFDHQVFFRKLEEKYDILAELASNNVHLATAFDDSSDAQILNQLCVDIKNDDNNNRPSSNESNRKLFIERIKICDKPIISAQTNSISPNNNNNYYYLENGENNEEETVDQEIGEEIENQQQPQQQQKININLKSEKLAFRCTHSKCDFLTFNHDDIIKHFSNHGVVTTTKRFEKTDVLYVCDQCGKEFSGQKWLDNHIENVHAYVKNYSCDFPNCSYSTKFRCVMDDHRKRHSVNKEFKCTWVNNNNEKCSAAFVTKRDMMAHINFFHKNIKNYICSWENCNASFKDSNRLRHHFYTHTGERPYRCDYPGCMSSFKQMPHLHKHRKTHSNLDTI